MPSPAPPAKDRGIPLRVARALREWPSAVYWEGRLALRSLRRQVHPRATRRVGGLRIALAITSSSEHYRADTYATKEPETIDWLRSRLREGDVFFDVGANVGLYSIFAAMFRPTARVYAFEPESHNFSSLCRNLLLNRLDNVLPCCIPLSDREGFDAFHVYALEPGSALHSLGGPSELREGRETMRQGTIATTLDALTTRHGLPRPALLKLDVDGIEERILAGAESLLGGGVLRSILVEVTEPEGGGANWAQRRLSPFGFSLRERSAWSTEIRGLESRNFIFDR